MLPLDPRQRRRLIPSVHRLEPRTLLTTVTCPGQDSPARDFVGLDASQGSDGIQDLHLLLSGLQDFVDHIVVQSAGGFRWETRPNPTGSALAEFLPDLAQGPDLYINPEIRSNLPPPGGSLPLGGSTGSPIGLVNGQQLLLTVYYVSHSPENLSVNVAGLVSATNPMPPTPVPASVVGTFQVTSASQDGSGPTGFVHMVVTAPSGITFNSNTFSQIVWGLSDNVGIAWRGYGVRPSFKLKRFLVGSQTDSKNPRKGADIPVCRGRPLSHLHQSPPDGHEHTPGGGEACPRFMSAIRVTTALTRGLSGSDRA
jgi:hypothetical protein